MKRLLFSLPLLLALCGAVSAQVPGASAPMVPIGGSGGGGGTPLNGFFSCTAGICTAIGTDGSTQFMIGNVPGSVEWIQEMGAIAGGGGSLICRNQAQTGNVNCNFTAQGAGSIIGNNGHGVLYTFLDPGGTITANGQVQLTPTATAGPVKIGNSLYGVNLDCGTTNLECQIAGQPIQAAEGVYAFNVNGDFQIDQPNEGNASATLGIGLATDGWRTISTKGNILTYQRSTTVPSTVGPFYTSGTITNGTAQTLAAGDHVELISQLLATQVAPALEGTASAKPMTLDVCLMSNTAGVTFPATIPVFVNNLGGGANYRSFVHLVTLSAVSTWTCTSVAIPGDTTSTGWSAPTSLAAGFEIGISLGCGTTFQTSTLDAWFSPSATSPSYCTAASTALVTTASSEIFMTGVHLRLGTQNWTISPFQALPYETELARARTRYWKSFRNGTKPSTNVGVGTGEIQFPATATTTGTQRAQTVTFPPLVNTTAPTVTFFNPAAANANCRDETAAADGGAGTATNVTTVGANAVNITCTGNAATAVNNVIGVHMTIDSGL